MADPRGGTKQGTVWSCPTRASMEHCLALLLHCRFSPRPSRPHARADAAALCLCDETTVERTVAEREPAIGCAFQRYSNEKRMIRECE